MLKIMKKLLLSRLYNENKSYKLKYEILKLINLFICAIRSPKVFYCKNKNKNK